MKKTVLLYKIHRWLGLTMSVVMLLLCLTGGILLIGQDMTGDSSQEEGMYISARELWQDLPVAMLSAEVEYPSWNIYSVRVDEQKGILRLQLRNNDSASASSDKKLLLWQHVQQSLLEKQAIKSDNSLWNMVSNVSHDLHLRLGLGSFGHELLKVLCVLFLLIIVTGVMLYPSFMKGISFGARRKYTKRLYWADMHKFLGIVSGTWLVILTASALIILLYTDARASYGKSAWYEAENNFISIRDDVSGLGRLTPLGAVNDMIDEIPDRRVVAMTLPSSKNSFYGFEVTDIPKRQGNFSCAEWYFLTEDGKTVYSKSAPIIVKLGEWALNLHLHNHDGRWLHFMWLVLVCVSVGMVISGVLAYGFRFTKILLVHDRNQVVSGSRDNCVWKWPVIVCGFSIAGLFLPLLPGAGIVAGGIFLGLVMLIYVYFLVV